MKDYPITIGFDDAQFNFNSSSQKTTQLIGVVCQGTRLVKVLRKQIEIDGDDSTEALIELVKKAEKHVQYILSDSITFAGFNICNLNEIYESSGKPIVAVTEREVDLESVKKALINKFSSSIYKEKLKNILSAGNLYETEVETAGGNSKIFFHAKGIEFQKVNLLLKKICIDSKLPEPVRLAHIIGKLF